MKKLALVFIALGCSANDAEDHKCVFSGRYDVGMLSETAACVSNSVQLPFYGEDECIVDIDVYTPELTRRQGVISCEPGDPVIECGGFASDSDGCRFTLYVRRLAP